MIRAGALTYAVFVTVVAAILCTLMIMLAFANRNFFSKINTNEQVKDLAYSGVAWGMAGTNTKTVPFLGAEYKLSNGAHLWTNDVDTLKVRERNWGAFKVISADGRSKGYSYGKGTFVANIAAKYQGTALYITDYNRPLQLAGDALIKGDAWLPEKGAEGSYIEGSNYKRSELVYGKKQRIANQLITIDESHKKYGRDYLLGHFGVHDSVIGGEGLTDELTHGFLKPTLTIAQPSPITLEYSNLHGNIIIYSGNSIRVNASTKLEDVLLVAPKVIVEKGVIGNFHIIASDSAIINEDVQLSFPSSISMIPNNNQDAHCVLRKGVGLYGLLISYSEKKQKTNNVNVSVAEGAMVRGMVYAEDNLEIRGEVQGQVFCNRFLLKTRSGVYENHLLDGKIDRSKVGQPLVGINMKNEESEVVPVKWFTQ